MHAYLYALPLFLKRNDMCFLYSNTWYIQANMNSVVRSNLDLVKKRAHIDNHRGAEALYSVFAWPHSPNLCLDAARRSSELLTGLTQARALAPARPPSSGPALLGSPTAFTAKVSVPHSDEGDLEEVDRATLGHAGRFYTSGEAATEAMANFRCNEKILFSLMGLRKAAEFSSNDILRG